MHIDAESQLILSSAGGEATFPGTCGKRSLSDGLRGIEPWREGFLERVGFSQLKSLKHIRPNSVLVQYKTTIM